MKKTLAGVIFGLLVMVTLGAQTAKPRLAIRDLAGGSRSDGKNITAMLTNQALIRENFTRVAEAGNPDYIISGEIRRVGISYIASFVMTDAKTGEELATEQFVYRDSLEITAYVPAIAYSLSSAARPGIARRGNIIPLPEVEIPAIVEVPVVVAVAPPAPPVEVEVEVEVQVEPPKPAPKPAPVPAPVAPATPVVPPAPEAPPVPATDADKLFHVSAWLSLSPLGGETERYQQNTIWWGPLNNEGDGAGQKYPPIGIALELDLRPFKHLGFKANLMGTSMSQDRKVYFPPDMYVGETEQHYHSAAYGLLLTIAPEFLFRLFDRDFGVYLGLASYTHTHEWKNLGIPQYATDTSVGIYTGLEGEILKLGPGDLFATLNMAFLFGTSGKNPENPVFANWNHRGRLKNASALNIGVGYRFGFIAKKSK
jgi:hypothetical protein